MAATETPTACPDPIECGHEAALGQAQQDIRRLGLMVDDYAAGASALGDKLRRVRDLHRETCILARNEVRPTAFTCGMCEVLDAPASDPSRMADAAQQSVSRQWCKCPSCWGWFVEDHPGEDLDELGKDLGWWSGLPEHRDAPAAVSLLGAAELEEKPDLNITPLTGSALDADEQVEPADRTALIREAIDRLETRARQAPAPGARLHSFRDVARVLIAELRDMGDEAQQQVRDCPACAAGLDHTEHCPTPETHNWGCGCPSDVAAAIASCPGYGMTPSPCRCPCDGCKHHCSAHQPAKEA